MHGPSAGQELFDYGPYGPGIGFSNRLQKERILNSLTKAVMAGVAAAALAAAPLALSASSAIAADHPHSQIKHVLLISVDGMHQSDLDWYITHHPSSELARLATGGAEYTAAKTSDPSDSDQAARRS